MEDIQSRNWIEFGYRWFNLPSYQELYHDVERICNSMICPINGLREYNREGLQNIFIDNPDHPKYKDNNPLQEIFIENDHEEKYVAPDTDIWNKWREIKESGTWNI